MACAYVRNPEAKGHGPRESAAMAQAVETWAHRASRENGLIADLPGSFRHVDTLVLEFPQVYMIGGGRTKGDPNDLLPLAAVDGAISVLFPSANITSYLPREWKGTVEKEVTGRRVREHLKAAELVVLARGLANLAPSLGHNVEDGIGVGLKFHGRFERKRVFHRE